MSWLSAFAFCGDLLALTTTDLSACAAWHTKHFALEEVQRTASTVVLQRGGARFGFAVNSNDPENDSAVIWVADAAAARAEVEATGVEAANWRVEEKEGKRHQARRRAMNTAPAR